MSSINATEIRHPQKAMTHVLDDSRNHQPQLILMDRQKDGRSRPVARTCTALAAEKVADTINDHLVDERPPDLLDHGRRSAFTSARAGSLR